MFVLRCHQLILDTLYLTAQLLVFHQQLLFLVGDDVDGSLKQADLLNLLLVLFRMIFQVVRLLLALRQDLIDEQEESLDNSRG